MARLTPMLTIQFPYRGVVERRPRSAAYGLRWWEVDPSGIVIRAMRRVGLAWNVVLISPKRQRQRLAAIESGP